MSKSPDAFRTISEVAEWLGIQAHVLRFWESKFTQVKPVKRARGRRYYRPGDMLLLGGIKKLLHEDGVTIKGVQKMLREQGAAQISALSPPLDDIDGETVQHDAGAKVLAFTGRQVESADTAEPSAPQPAPPPSESASAPPVMLEPHAVPPESTLASGDQVVVSEDAHHPAPTAETQARLDLSAPPKAQPRAQIVDAPDPPPESQIIRRPGPLGRLAGIDHLTADQARAIAPLVQKLRAIVMHRAEGTRT